ncbi:MAG: hypothetical protein WKG00_14625 [Polyangiaceae bacterium]
MDGVGIRARLGVGLRRCRGGVTSSYAPCASAHSQTPVIDASPPMPTTTSKPVVPVVSPSSWGSISAAFAPPPVVPTWSLSMNTNPVTPLPGAAPEAT